MIEKIYEDFNTYLAPKIQEGLVIAKDYFVDIFWRYRNYLLVTDGLQLLLGIILFVLFGILLKKALVYIKKKGWYEDCVFGIIFGLVILLVVASCFFFCSIGNVIKDIFIPEIRIFEIIKNLQ